MIGNYFPRLLFIACNWFWFLKYDLFWLDNRVSFDLILDTGSEVFGLKHYIRYMRLTRSETFDTYTKCIHTLVYFQKMNEFSNNEKSKMNFRMTSLNRNHLDDLIYKIWWYIIWYFNGLWEKNEAKEIS